MAMVGSDEWKKEAAPVVDWIAKSVFLISSITKPETIDYVRSYRRNDKERTGSPQIMKWERIRREDSRSRRVYCDFIEPYHSGGQLTSNGFN